jgi:hypothetical protein
MKTIRWREGKKGNKKRAENSTLQFIVVGHKTNNGVMACKQDGGQARTPTTERLLSGFPPTRE